MPGSDIVCDDVGAYHSRHSYRSLTAAEFEPIDVAWGQTVILQELITQLIQSGALPVERVQRVFDSAFCSER
jgi:hypothetical protein